MAYGYNLAEEAVISEPVSVRVGPLSRGKIQGNSPISGLR